MTLIFWQGIISIHQQSFLEALAVQPGVARVMLVVEEDITDYRKNMGWDVPAIAGVEVRQSPSGNEIEQIISGYAGAIHIFGGIRVGKMMSAALDICIRRRCRIGVMTEPYNAAGLKGWLRSMKYQYFRLRYFRHINFVLAIGRQGVAQYHMLGFHESRLFAWAYFINVDAVDDYPTASGSVKKIIYAGRIEEGKGIFKFTQELVHTGRSNFSLDIYGDGPDEGKLQALIAANGLQGRISRHPFLKHNDLLKKYREYDWVALPSSQKDGWGVIVSEGLLYGLKAICSDICGVSWVIQDGVNGVTFNWGEAGSCAAAVSRLLGEEVFASRAEIIGMAARSVSGQAGASYFLDIMACVYNDGRRPGIPWLNTEAN